MHVETIIVHVEAEVVGRSKEMKMTLLKLLSMRPNET